MDYGICSVCGQPVLQGAAFVNIGPTDSADPAKPRRVRYVPVDEDIHGWSPFVLNHPACYASEYGLDALLRLVDESHRFMRSVYKR